MTPIYPEEDRFFHEEVFPGLLRWVAKQTL